MDAFAWIKDIIEFFGQFIPRKEVLNTTRGWVKWVNGKDIQTGTAGTVWWFPWTTQFAHYPVVRQTTPLPPQFITTKDQRTVSVTGLLVYEVTDLPALLAHTYDPEDTAKDIAMSSLYDVCIKLTWEEIQTLGRKLDTRLKNEAREDLKEFGISVLKFTLTNAALCSVNRVIRSTFQEGETGTSTS